MTSDCFDDAWLFCKSVTISRKGIRWQESRFAIVSKALCESTDGQNDRRPVKRRFSPYPATWFPREDIPVCVDTHGPTCVIQWPTIFIGSYVSLWLKLCDHAIQSFTNERRTFAFRYFMICIILYYILSVHKICRYIKNINSLIRIS